jgi:hypothetical protein
VLRLASGCPCAPAFLPLPRPALRPPSAPLPFDPCCVWPSGRPWRHASRPVLRLASDCPGAPLPGEAFQPCPGNRRGRPETVPPTRPTSCTTGQHGLGPDVPRTPVGTMPCAPRCDCPPASVSGRSLSHVHYGSMASFPPGTGGGVPTDTSEMELQASHNGPYRGLLDLVLGVHTQLLKSGEVTGKAAECEAGQTNINRGTVKRAATRPSLPEPAHSRFNAGAGLLKQAAIVNNAGRPMVSCTTPSPRELNHANLSFRVTSVRLGTVCTRLLSGRLFVAPAHILFRVPWRSFLCLAHGSGRLFRLAPRPRLPWPDWPRARPNGDFRTVGGGLPARPRSRWKKPAEAMGVQ